MEFSLPSTQSDMKLAIFSDIHGNAQALSLALTAMASHSPDAYFFLGDLCGYYYESIEAWRQLLDLPNLQSVLGNHDRIFLDIVSGNTEIQKEYSRKYGRAMESLLDQEHGGLVSWLQSLPEILVDKDLKLLVCHGSPASSLDEYIYPDTTMTPPPPSGWMLLMGHTHYRMQRVVNGANLINPGSIGQPRDGGKPSWCMVDTTTHEAVFFDVDFHVGELVRQVRARKETNPYLEQVLLRQEGTVDDR